MSTLYFFLLNRLHENTLFGYSLLILLLLSLSRILERTVDLFLHLPLPVRPFMASIEDHLHSGDLPAALELCRRHPRALIARLTSAAFEASAAPAPLGRSQKEILMHLRPRPYRRLALLRAMPWLCMGASGWGFLLNFDRGFVESAVSTPAGQMAMTARVLIEGLELVSLGVLTAAICRIGIGVLTAQARRLEVDLHLAAAWLEKCEALAPMPAVPCRWLARRQRNHRPLQHSLGWIGPAPEMLVSSLILAIVLICLVKDLHGDELGFLLPTVAVPASTSTLSMLEGVRVAVHNGTMWVEGRQLLVFHNNSKFLPPELGLFSHRLLELKAHRLHIESLGGPVFDRVVLVAADRDLAYGRLYEILQVAASAGFSNPKLIVLPP